MSKEKDFFGNTLELGDEVAFMRPYYKQLLKGVIINFTPKMVTVQELDHNGDLMYGKYDKKPETRTDYSTSMIKNMGVK